VQIDALNVRVRVVKIRTYVAAIVTHQRMAGPSLTVTGSERKTGGQARGSDNSSAQDERGWLRLAG